MAVSEVPTSANALPANGAPALEERQRHLFAEQRRLRALLDQARAELDRVNAEVLRTQMEHCTSPEREDEYCQSSKELLDFDPREELKSIEEARKNPIYVEDVLAELEQLGSKWPGALR